jgi:lipopolysaccharide export LptBFGC system permease protein LptF
MFAALLASAGFLAAREYAVPYVAVTRTALETRLFNKTPRLGNVIVRESRNGVDTVFHIEELRSDGVSLTASGFHAYSRPAASGRIEYHSAEAIWQTDGSWQLVNGKCFTYSESSERSEEPAERFASGLSRASYFSSLPPSSFHTDELVEFSASAEFSYELNSRYAESLALFLLGLLVLASAAMLARAGMYQALTFSLIAAVLWYGLTFISSASHAAGPVLIPWGLALLVFAAAAAKLSRTF